MRSHRHHPEPHRHDIRDDCRHKLHRSVDLAEAGVLAIAAVSKIGSPAVALRIGAMRK